MGWYILQCRIGQEKQRLITLKKKLTSNAAEDIFLFQCQRLWKNDGCWKLVRKDMFPGYIFIQSGNPEYLSDELKQLKGIVKAMEEPGYLFSVYQEEEQYLRELCGKEHVLNISYGYKDQKAGVSHIIKGPLYGWENRIKKLDWHKRYAQIEIPVLRRYATVWAGIDIISDMNSYKNSKKTTSEQSILVS